MPNLYRCADVFVHACTNESFALAYVEALASGVPVVAHDNELTQWILGDGDERVDTFDEVAYLEAIERALRSSPDEVNRRVKNAQNRFSWSSIADTYEVFLAEVIDRHRRS